MGEAYLNLGLAGKAAESYARARAIDPTFTQARGGHAFALAALGRFDEAIAMDPRPGQAKLLLLSRVGRYREAAQVAVGNTDDASALESFGGGAFHLLAAAIALERGDYRGALREADAAEAVFAPAKLPRKNPYLLLTHLVAGIAEARRGNVSEARSRLERQKRLYRTGFDHEAWWHHALEAEIALAEGDAQRAQTLFSTHEPRQKFFAFDPIGGVLFANHLPSRDGAARAAIARGDVPGAIAAYRRLLTFGESKWVSVLEPRYVLELARLLEKSGDSRQALQEYERFLALWHRADPELPELAEARRAVTRLRTSTSG